MTNDNEALAPMAVCGAIIGTVLEHLPTAPELDSVPIAIDTKQWSSDEARREVLVRIEIRGQIYEVRARHLMGVQRG